jgi:carboxypeptidase family protein
MSRSFRIGLVTLSVVATVISGVSRVSGSQPAQSLTGQPAANPGAQLPAGPPATVATIEGHVFDSARTPMADEPVRLRNARTGQVVTAQRTDVEGAFRFRAIDPGSYVVEALAVDQKSVAAASDLVSPGAGDTVIANVTLPIDAASAAALITKSPASLAAIAGLATTAGILAAQVAGAATCMTVQ